MLTREEAKKASCRPAASKVRGFPDVWNIYTSQPACFAEGCPKWVDTDKICPASETFRQGFKCPHDDASTTHNGGDSMHCNTCPNRYGRCGG